MNDNPKDIRGVYTYRFKWKAMINAPPDKIRSIILKIDQETDTNKYYFELIQENVKNITLSEILNVKMLSKIEQESKNFKVIGAKGRNIIIGEINLNEFEINIGNLLILSSLTDWRKFDSV